MGSGNKPMDRETTMIFYLAKVFEHREHADKFIRGEVYCRTLAYFKELEDQHGRGDSDEGAIVLPLEGLVMTLESTDPGTGEVTKHILEGFAAPPVLVPEWFDHINLYCMFAAHFPDKISKANKNRVEELLRIPEEFNQLGRHAVGITDYTEFLTRVRSAAERAGYGVCSGLVNYYDPEISTPPIHSEIETIFSKRKEFAYQREFRIAIDTGNTEGKEITLDIGDIRDIAFHTDTGGLGLELNLRPEESMK